MGLKISFVRYNFLKYCVQVKYSVIGKAIR